MGLGAQSHAWTRRVLDGTSWIRVALEDIPEFRATATAVADERLAQDGMVVLEDRRVPVAEVRKQRRGTVHVREDGT